MCSSALAQVDFGIGEVHLWVLRHKLRQGQGDARAREGEPARQPAGAGQAVRGAATAGTQARPAVAHSQSTPQQQ